VIGKDGSIINSDQQDEAFYRKSRARPMQQQGSWSGEMWQKRKDGRDFLCAVQFNAIVEPWHPQAPVRGGGSATSPTEARRAGTALPRQLRHPDRPAQPHPAGRTPVARDRARAPAGHPGGGAVPRPGPLQGHQRFAGPRRRRPHPARGRARLQDRRRRVHTVARWAATSSPWCWRISPTWPRGRALRAKHHRRLRRAAAARRPPRDRDLALDRHQPVPRPRAGAHRPAQARRHRDVPGQGSPAAAPSRSTPMRWTATSAAAPP
jgi:hypothetical protein